MGKRPVILEFCIGVKNYPLNDSHGNVNKLIG